ncbi:HAD family phosphatase [Acetobacteraceae bacterium]|nr:HAD family phosphatase [Candidatus Parcubacteria bacterium]
MKKAVIFDLNGVFVIGPFLSDRFATEKGVAPEIFLPALKEILPAIQSPGANSIYSYWKPYLEKWNTPMSEKEFLDFWFKVEKENAEMVALARELRAKGVRLFILSNNMNERSAYYDAEFPFLEELFEKQYYSWKTGFIKPDPRAHELILTENNLEARECMYFDDSARNVAAALVLGIESYLFTDATQVREKLGL